MSDKKDSNNDDGFYLTDEEVEAGLNMNAMN